MCRAIAVDLSATRALVQDHVALFGIGLHANGLHRSLAGVGAVAGVDVDVKRPEAERAMVSGGVAQRQDLTSAMRANKAVIVFRKPFLFHRFLP